MPTLAVAPNLSSIWSPLEYLGYLPGQEVVSATPTKIIIGKYADPAAGTWAQDRAEIIGTNLSYDPATGAFGGTITAIQVLKPDPAAAIPLSITAIELNAAVYGPKILNGDSMLGDTLSNAFGWTLNGSQANDYYEGGVLKDTLRGNGGNDHLSGGGGDDVIQGGEDGDFLYGDGGSDRIFGGGGGDFLYAYDNGVSGNAAHSDYLAGGAEGDNYYVDSANDVVDESVAGSSGYDTVWTWASFSLATTKAAAVENLRLEGTANLNGTGNALNNHINGNDGTNVIRGGGGDDNANGNDGNDTIYGDAGNDYLDGGDGADKIYGGAGRNNLNGGDGDDYLEGGSDGEHLVGGAGSDTLIGGNGNDYLHANESFGTTKDGAADRLMGGAGDDTYTIQEVTDIVDESVPGSGGHDKIDTSVSISLLDASRVKGTVEDIRGEGSAAIKLTGSQLDNRISGNYGANTIEGLGGDDSLDGSHGNDSIRGGSGEDYAHGGKGHDRLYGDADGDSLYGGGGNDTLDGGAGEDYMSGDAGNDIFVVDNAEDSISDSSGTDLVRSSISFDLSELHSDIEKLTLVGAGNLRGTGNELANVIVGNAGASTLAGKDGNDIYVVSTAGTKIVEAVGEGTADKVVARVSFTLAADDHIEIVQAQSGTTAIGITGNALVQKMAGNTGNNVINGGGGSDALTGAAGNDTFAFTTALGATNVDRIIDFGIGADKIRLENGIFVGLGTGSLPGAAFKDLATDPKDVNDRILYNSNSGELFYDRDGSGAAFAAIKFAVLINKADLSAADFVVV